jgi:hypothetical protein
MKLTLPHMLDYAIRDMEGKPYGAGYKLEKTEGYYDRYMSNDGWHRYLDGMSKDHRDQYEKGDGGELKEGKYPPKMACYGSSSRIIFTLLKDIPDIKFEYPLKTYVYRGCHPANLDGYLCADNADIFVEAKCREIYTEHGKVKASREYCKVYEYISDNHKNFSFDKKDVIDKNANIDESVYNYSFFYNNEPIIHFDIKQLISHFLGIAAGVLESRVKDSIRFVYFIYNPIELQNESLSNIYNKTIAEIDKIRVSELFKTIFEYQKHARNIEKEAPLFEFVMADQHNIIDYFQNEDSIRLRPALGDGCQ